MRAKIRKILEECIENGIVIGYSRAHKHGEHPEKHHIQQCIEDAIWLEIDERFDFERNLCDEVVKGFDHLEAKRNKCNDHPDAPKREWVYLTEEEMLHIVNRDGMQLAEAIEAKLKEKNT